MVRLPRREDRVSLEMHRVVATKLRQDPKPILDLVPQNVARQRDHVRGPVSHAWLAEWEALASGPVEELIAVMLDTSSHGINMRQVGPFHGVLTQEERLEAIARAAKP